MSKTANVIISGAVIGVAAFGTWYVVNGLRTQNAADKLKLEFQGLSNFRIADGKIKFDLHYSALNPTTKTLDIEQMYLNIGVKNTDGKGFKIAQVEHTDHIPIQGKRKVYGKIAIESGAIWLMGVNVAILIYSMIKNGAQLPTIATINGQVMANGFSEDYNENIPLVQKPVAVPPPTPIT